MKTKSLLLLLLSCILLTSCQEESQENDTKSPIIISEFHTFSSSYNRALELYNNSPKDISLDDYEIKINQTAEEYNYTIKLSGVLKAYNTYVVAKESSSEEILAKANLISSELWFNGTQAIILMKNNKIVDIVGTFGFQYDYANYLDMCRKKEYLIGRKTYRPYDWVRYSPDNVSRLGNIDVMDDKTLCEGPHLTSEDFNKPFGLGEGNGYGGGGAVTARLNYVGDGDTTNFYFSSFSPYLSRNESVRYLCIDTPEIDHGSYISAAPWGYPAKKYNNEVLKKAKSYAISSCPNYSLRDTYGRLLAFVWVAYNDNPLPEDYELLNFLMVKEGYSTLRYINGHTKHDLTNYKGISYGNYMRNVELTAIENKIKVHGEIDPDFNY